ncbi:MAG: PIN domain-containing protein [Ignavibacteriales bacterium]|nr:PIN domain-containing protein [Ignavibacteriales bacterium]
MLLFKQSKLRKIFFNQNVEFISPNFTLIEIFKHKRKLLMQSQLKETEIDEMFNMISSRITFVEEYQIALENRALAYNLCKDIDEADTPFMAAAIEFEAFLWTSDKKLKTGLTKRGFTNFFIPSKTEYLL